MKPLFIFDMGGVMVRNFSVWEKLPSLLEVSEPYLKAQAGLLNSMMRGEISSSEFFIILAHRLKKTVSPENYWGSLFHPELIPQSIQLVNELRQRGYRVVAGTNVLDVHYDYHMHHKHYQCFDKVYASHIMGVIKPELSFWHYILAQENKMREWQGKEQYTFSDMYFFDDDIENVNAASSLGINAFLFTDPENAKKTLSLFL